MRKIKSPTRRPQHATRDRRRPAAGDARNSQHAWLFGLHATAAALANPRRTGGTLLATREGAERLARLAPDARPEIVDRALLDQRLPPGAVHQGVALSAEPLDQPDLEDILGGAGEAGILVILDQVADPHNVGAVLRSAAAFGALAVIQTERGAPGATGVLAKAASGALEVTPLISVTNLARTLDAVQAAGFWCIGLDGAAEHTLAEAAPSGRIALVLGAEGKGLRRLTRDHCDLLVRLPTRPPIDSLNVSNAAAVALYELARGRDG